MPGKKLKCEEKLAEKGYNAVMLYIDYVLPGVTVETFLDLNTLKRYVATTLDGDVVGISDMYD